MPLRDRGSLQALRESNRERLLSLLRENGGLHRAELARRAGLSRTTVSTIVTDLLAESQVVELPADGVGRGAAGGRAGGLLTLNPAAGLALGIDFSFREVRVILADLAHTVLAERVAEIEPDRNPPENLELAATLAEEALTAAAADRSRLIGVGLGVPGPVDMVRQEIGFSSNSAGWVGTHAATDLAARLGVPVAMDNTSHLGCLAEAIWGAGTGCPNLLYLKLGYGVGSGFVVDGKIYRGVIGAAGEIGHITVDEMGPACRCGSRGCLEAYAGVPTVLDALRPVLGAQVTVGDVLAAARADNRAACRVLTDVGQVIGRTLASVCNLLNPGRIVVGGDLAPAGELLLGAIRDALGRRALQIVAESVDVVPAALGEQAGALGGVALVLHERERLTGPAAERLLR